MTFPLRHRRFASLLCAALLATACSGSHDEPRSGGEPLSHWAKEAHQYSILPWLSSRGDERRREAFQHLVAIGEPAVATLVELLEDGNVSTRGDALDALCALGPRAATATPALIRRLERRTDPRATALLLGCLGAQAEAAVPALEAASRSGDPRLRELAAEALAAIGGAGDPALERLADASDPDHRRAALAGRAGGRRAGGAGSAEHLLRALGDPAPGVRQDALQRFRPSDETFRSRDLAEAGLEAVLAASRDPDAGVREAAESWLLGAARALGQAGLARMLAEAGPAGARRQAAWSLGLARLQDRETVGDAALSALEGALGDPDPMVRVYAVRALAHLPGTAERLAPVVRNAMASLSLRDRLAAAPILYGVSRVPGDVEPIYRELLQSPELTTWARHILDFAGIESIVRALRPELESLAEHPNRVVRRNVQRALETLESGN